MRGEKFRFLWEFKKHLPSYQPLKILTASRKLGYFCDHIDNSNRQIVLTMSLWSPASLAALMLGSVELNHMHVGGSRELECDGCLPVFHRLTEEHWLNKLNQQRIINIRRTSHGHLT